MTWFDGFESRSFEVNGASIHARVSKTTLGEPQKPALLLLQFKPAYRPDLEAWKTAHPQGVRQFVNTAHVMP